MDSFEEWLTGQQMNLDELQPAELESLRRHYEEHSTPQAREKEREERFRGNFLDYGTQYYVAARLAARAGLMPIHGNLFHHAVEMYLKAALVRTLSIAKMRKISHSLPVLWEHFKKEADPALARFDPTIDALHEFDSIRYPDKPVEEGMAVSVVWQPEDVTSLGGTGKMPKLYGVVIATVDELIIEVLHRASVNPRFLISSIQNSTAREAFAYQNPQVALWL
jgi:hypothetical protein